MGKWRLEVVPAAALAEELRKRGGGESPPPEAYLELVATPAILGELQRRSAIGAVVLDDWSRGDNLCHVHWGPPVPLYRILRIAADEVLRAVGDQLMRGMPADRFERPGLGENPPFMGPPIREEGPPAEEGPPEGEGDIHE